ncbi:alpha/beta hydrolase [Rhodanobacter sp. 7MK24]|uniref:alpha/beta hydrolase n=1 Tax=Rhodanobacter sp. 7MK24 TaxID=2775922 RepID=UPI00177C518D|nr:alpha/beta hydrolase [Rhodanobacter sp. 7MK24]MBD8880130.1 alpha/beta hydrolase [Rhodanobacter sp. 7MK24]
MAGATASLEMPDGQPLRLHDWPLPQAQRGGVLIVHGLGEHAGRYEALARWFNTRGYTVRSYDQRGHGESPGPRGVLSHPDDLLADLAVVYADYARTLGIAPLLLGHSMGGLVALRAVLDERITPKALVLSSPALRSHASPGLQRLAATLAHLLPGLRLRNGLELERLSHDPQVVAAYCNDPLCHDRVSPRLADFIFRAGASCIADAGRLEVPTLLLVAGDDALVDAAGSRDFAAVAARTKQLTTRYFAALYHELFNEAEPGRTQVLRQLVRFLAKIDRSRLA